VVPVLLYLLFILNMIDATLTTMIVTEYGFAAELNPIMRFFLEQFGIAGMYVFKGATIAFLALALWIQNNEASAMRILITLNIGFLAVIAYTSHLFD
jgi:hypothetical protein